MQKNVEKMTTNYSPNFYLNKRHKKKIKYLIFHYTGMKNDKSAIKRLTSFNSNVSCHYYINSYGKLIQMVPDLYVAWHAGKSKWGNQKSLNYNSIGISSGASVPDILVMSVIDKLKDSYELDVEEMTLGDENVSFRIPSSLR